MQPFIHLRLHTEYSLVDGIVRIKALVKSAVDLGMPAVAITDQSNLFGMVKFYRAAIAMGVKPIIGVDVWVQHDSAANKHSRLVLLCVNHQGYQHLTQLVTRSYLEGQQRGLPLVKIAWLKELNQGLIALSADREGDIGQALLAGKSTLAQSCLQEWQTLFPDRFYLELQRTGREQEEDYLHAAVHLASVTSTPVVATNDVRFLNKAEFEAHEARVCIHEGRVLDDPRRPRIYSEQQYLRSSAEMASLFSDIPEALENTLEIAKICNVELQLGNNVLPDFPVPAGTTIDRYFREQAHAGLERRLVSLFDVNSSEFTQIKSDYVSRLEFELTVINKMGFAGYFLIVADFIKWAKNNDIPVGPGRGSGAGSLVAYVLTITDLDPIKHELLFERFLNPERVSMPDFDIDFCMESRDRVIAYVADRYGRDKVSQIITYGTMAAKAVVRDVGRVLGFPYGFVDQIAKLIPFAIGMTLDDALAQEELLMTRYEKEEDVHTLIDLARSLEGITRNAGKHAGGVVIAPSKLTDFCPLYCEHGATNVVTQFDKDDVEAIGLVKFDFLGLRTLTIIDWALKTINEQARQSLESPVDINTIPTDDKATFDLLKDCKTTAVFQLESRGMKDLIKRLQPDSFEEIIALVALFRPGPLQSGMVDDFIDRKHGRAKVNYPHPKLEAVLKPTYGVILYQEQVMQIAQILAGYTMGSADILRRAMGKKKHEEMAKQRVVFIEGASKQGVDRKVSETIFDLMEKFAGYGFNKSHSAAYALIAYQTAWLKAHYPAAFMAAVLSADMDNTDKVVTLIDECRHIKLKVLPPNINDSQYRFAVKDSHTINYGLGAIKGVGESAIDVIVKARTKDGPFDDIFDLCQRMDARKVNKRAMDALISSGTLDQLGSHRASLLATLPQALQIAEKRSQDSSSGQSDLFGGAESKSEQAPQYTQVGEWDEEQRLSEEKRTLGLYLTGHPIFRYKQELEKFVTANLSKLNADSIKTTIVSGLVVAIRTMRTRTGDKIAFITLDDATARIDVTVYAEGYQRHRDILIKDKVIVVEGEVSHDDFSGGLKVIASNIYDIVNAREHFAKNLLLQADTCVFENQMLNELEGVLAPYLNGTCRVAMNYFNDGAKVQLSFGKDWCVHPTNELLDKLRGLIGPDNVTLVY